MFGNLLTGSRDGTVLTGSRDGNLLPASRDGIALPASRDSILLPAPTGLTDTNTPGYYYPTISKELSDANAAINSASHHTIYDIACSEYSKLSQPADRSSFFMELISKSQLGNGGVKRFIAYAMSCSQQLPVAAFSKKYNIPDSPYSSCVLAQFIETNNFWLVDLLFISYKAWDLQPILPALWDALAARYIAGEQCESGLIKVLDILDKDTCLLFQLEDIVFYALKANSTLYATLVAKSIVNKQKLMSILPEQAIMHSPALFVKIASTVFTGGVAMPDLSSWASETEGIDLNAVFDRHGSSLLELAVRNCCAKEVRDFILSCDIDVNRRNKLGQSILKYVAPEDTDALDKIFAKGFILSADLLEHTFLLTILLNFEKFAPLMKDTHPGTKYNILHLIFAQDDAFICRYNDQIRHVIAFVAAHCPEQIYNCADDVKLEHPIFMAISKGYFIDELLAFTNFDILNPMEEDATTVVDQALHNKNWHGAWLLIQNGFKFMTPQQQIRDVHGVMLLLLELDSNSTAQQLLQLMKQLGFKFTTPLINGGTMFDYIFTHEYFVTNHASLARFLAGLSHEEFFQALAHLERQHPMLHRAILSFKCSDLMRDTLSTDVVAADLQDPQPGARQQVVANKCAVLRSYDSAAVQQVIANKSAVLRFSSATESNELVQEYLDNAEAMQCYLRATSFSLSCM